MKDWRDREGTLTYGSSVARLRLADTPRPYRPLSKAIWPDTKRIAGADPNEQDPTNIIARWVMRDWSRGELRGLWEPGGYNKSSNVKPDREGSRLELGAYQNTTEHDGGSLFTNAQKFGHGQALLWTCDDSTLHWWQVATEDWDETGWATGATTQTCVSITDMGNGTHMLVSFDDESIAKISSSGDGGDVWTAAAGAAFPSEIRYSDGTVYMLDGADLYSLDTSASDTRTALSTPGGRINSYMGSDGNLYRRMCVTDTGVAWLVPQDNGTTIIMEYNARSQTDRRIGELPAGSAFPYSIAFAYGFLFIGYRETSLHGEAGDARIYYQRGAQRGTTPPVRSTTGTTASKPVLIAGTIADDLMFFYDGAVWAYDLSAGSLFMVSAIAPTSGADDAATFGRDIFVSNATNAYRVDILTYTGQSASWNSGRFNFDLPGVLKALLRVTVVTDPLPADMQITLKVAADGGSFTDVTGTYSTPTGLTCTFDVTGGASEDLWTSTGAHGLAVGDQVWFTAVGTGAEPYAVDTVYWVASVPSSTTFQLSATDSTTVLEGTGSDSAGTWTLEEYKTTYEWTVSSASAQVTGRDFEIQLLPAQTNAVQTSSPQIREITVEAVAAEKRRGVEIDVDVGSVQVGRGAAGPSLLTNLRAAAEYSGGIVSFKDPWGTTDTQTATTSDVVVELLGGLAEDSFATIRLWEVGVR